MTVASPLTRSNTMESTERNPLRHDWGLRCCAFCGEAKELQLSHIVPRFVLAWIKRTSPTGHVRSSQDPNRRAQDSWKVRLLCRDCEQRFSKLETIFSNGLFRPIHESTTSTAQYGPWFGLLAASVCWRILKMYSLMDNIGGNFPTRLLPDAEKALDTWQRFLTGATPHPGRFEIHALRLDLIESTTLRGLPGNFNRYLYRTLDIDIASNQKSAFVYAKLCRVLIMGHIAMPGARRWHGTRISPTHGVFGAGDVRLPGELADFMADRARKLLHLHARISDRQRDQMETAMRADLVRVAESEVFTATQQDAAMFGSDAFALPDADDLTNES
jgi:hypothetical protein